MIDVRSEGADDLGEYEHKAKVNVDEVESW